MVTVWVALIAEGAVYNPFDRVPTMGFMDQVTEVFNGPVTVAANWYAWEAPRVTLSGLTLTLTVG